MPCVSYRRPNLVREGPTISVIVRPSTAFLSAQKEQGRGAEEVPFVRSTMLIDTGASGSAVDQEVLAQLGLQPTGSIAIATPSHDHHDVLTYDIDLIIEQNLFHIADVPVFATGLKNQGIHGLIGRDVLKHMLLVYNGYSGDFTLAV
jgi:predicted aspartyl protease